LPGVGTRKRPCVVAHVLTVMGILALFYGTDHKPIAMRLLRACDPASSLLPWITQGMRPTRLTVRLYDSLVVFAMAIQGCVIGLAIDGMRRLFRRQSAHFAAKR